MQTATKNQTNQTIATHQSPLQNRLGNRNFAATLQTTLLSQTAETSFKIYLVTIIQLEREVVDNLLALRTLLSQSSILLTENTDNDKFLRVHEDRRFSKIFLKIPNFS